MPNQGKLEFKRVGLEFSLEEVRPRNVADGIRYSAKIRDLHQQSRVAYSLNIDELVALHAWVTMELARKSGAYRQRRYGNSGIQ